MRLRMSIYVFVIQAMVLICVAKAEQEQNSLKGTQYEPLIQKKFLVKYEAWIQSMDKIWDKLERPIVHYPEKELTVDNPKFWELVKLGPQVFPFVLRESFNGYIEVTVIHKILGLSFSYTQKGNGLSSQRFYFEEFPDTVFVGGERPQYSYSCLRWWKSKEKYTDNWFEERYMAWQRSVSAGEGDKIKECLERIQDLGIQALPLLIEKIEGGDVELIPVTKAIADRAWVPEKNRFPNNASIPQIQMWFNEHQSSYQLPCLEAYKELFRTVEVNEGQGTEKLPCTWSYTSPIS